MYPYRTFLLMAPAPFLLRNPGTYPYLALTNTLSRSRYSLSGILALAPIPC